MPDPHSLHAQLYATTDTEAFVHVGDLKAVLVAALALLDAPTDGEAAGALDALGRAVDRCWWMVGRRSKLPPDGE